MTYFNYYLFISVSAINTSTTNGNFPMFTTSSPKGSGVSGVSTTTDFNFPNSTTAKYSTNTVSITNVALAGIITGAVLGVVLLLVAAIMLTVCVVRQR